MFCVAGLFGGWEDLTGRAEVRPCVRHGRSVRAFRQQDAVGAVHRKEDDRTGVGVGRPGRSFCGTHDVESKVGARPDALQHLRNRRDIVHGDTYVACDDPGIPSSRTLGGEPGRER